MYPNVLPSPIISIKFRRLSPLKFFFFFLQLLLFFLHKFSQIKRKMDNFCIRTWLFHAQERYERIFLPFQSHFKIFLTFCIQCKHCCLDSDFLCMSHKRRFTLEALISRISIEKFFLRRFSRILFLFAKADVQESWRRFEFEDFLLRWAFVGEFELKSLLKLKF